MLPTPHLDRLRTQLRQMPELITLAHLALLPGSGRRGARVSGATRTAPLPCRIDVLSAIGPTSAAAVTDPYGDQAVEPGLGILAGWAQVVLDDRRRANDWSAWARPHGRATERTVSVAIKVLLLHLDWSADRPYARDLAEEIGQLHAHLNRITGQPFAGLARRQPCPRCHLLTVAVRPDGMRECSSPDCWAVLSEQEYADRAEQALAELAAA